MSALATSQTVPAFKYHALLYSDGDSWQMSAGIRHYVEEIWIPSEKVAYNPAQGVFHAARARRSDCECCSDFESALQPVELTQEQVDGFLAQLKKAPQAEVCPIMESSSKESSR